MNKTNVVEVYEGCSLAMTLFNGGSLWFPLAPSLYLVRMQPSQTVALWLGMRHVTLALARGLNYLGVLAALLLIEMCQ